MLSHFRVLARLPPLLFALFALALLAPARAQTIDTISQWDGADYISSFGVPANDTFGQTITAPGNVALTSFTFVIKNLANDGSSHPIIAKAYVYAWDGQKATGPALFSSAPLSVATTASFAHYTVSTGSVSLASGAQYVLFLSTIGLQAGQPTNFSGWGLTAKSVYSGGSFVYQSTNGKFSLLTTRPWVVFSSGPNNNYDAAFQATFVSQGFAVGTLETKAHARANLTGYVTLPAETRAGGATVFLHSNNPLVIVPASVHVMQGHADAVFPIRTDATPYVDTLRAPVTVTIGATEGSLSAQSSLTILPANTARADGYVQNGAAADTNFGTARVLKVFDVTPDEQLSYLRFRVGGFHNVTKARLRLDASVPDGGSAVLGVYAVPDNHWQQNTLTFNDRPVVGTVLNTARVSGTTLTHYNIDVTPYVQYEQQHGRDVLSFALLLFRTSPSGVNVVSYETQDGQYLKPQLVVQGN